MFLHLLGEADIVSCHVRKLIQLGIGQEDIAVIAPYNLQVGRLLFNHL